MAKDKGTVAIEVVPDWTAFPVLAAQEFDRKVVEYNRLKLRIEADEKEKDQLGKEIEADLAIIGQKKVKYNDLTVVQCNGRAASKLDPRLLVEKGVDADLIEECTVPGREYTYIQVQKPKEKKQA